MGPAQATETQEGEGGGVSEALYIRRDSELLTGPSEALCQLGKGTAILFFFSPR